MRKLPMLVLTVGLLTSCRTGDEAFKTNSAPTAVTGPAASAIAGDMASRFAEQTGSPATTTIKLDKSETESPSSLGPIGITVAGRPVRVAMLDQGDWSL